MVSSPAEPSIPVHLADVFDAVCTRHADRPLVVFGGRRLSYGEARHEAVALAAALADLGIQPGAHVAVNFVIFALKRYQVLAGNVGNVTIGV